ncbi:MAG: Uma2 family endonuclease [Saprospiraceae bacterium]
MDTLVATLPELSDYEIERGKPMPSLNHGLIQGNTYHALISRYRGKFSFPTETSLDLEGWPSTPDILILPPIKLNLLVDKIKLTEPPLGIIEILSPTQSLNDLVDKANNYFESGVKSCWIIIPSMGGVAIYSAPGKYTFFNENDIARDEVLGLEVPVAELFT